MKRELNGSELAGFIKERQAKTVRGLRQAHGLTPRLAIIRTNPDPVVDSYMRIKQGYGQDIDVVVDVHTVTQDEALGLIAELNERAAVHGIIVQIPLPNPAQTDEILNAVAPDKDVDGLAAVTDFDAPTPVAINWLLSGYNIELKGRNIAVVGHGRLVGQPLVRMWQQSGLTPRVLDKNTQEIAKNLQSADIIVTATGVPGLITSDMVKPEAVIVDAGVATDSNGLIGDVAAEVRDLPTITMTPEKGGVGPLTVAALFENVLTACRNTIDKS